MAPKGAIHDSKYGTTRVSFASTYTAKQLKTIYYSLNVLFHQELEVLGSYVGNGDARADCQRTMTKLQSLAKQLETFLVEQSQESEGRFVSIVLYMSVIPANWLKPMRYQSRGGVLRFGLGGSVRLTPQNPYPFLGVILAENSTRF